MRSPIRRLYAHYRAYHQPSPLLLRYMCLFGLIGFPLLYLLRFLRSNPGYDDLPLRMLNVALLLVLVLRERWPERAKPYYLPSSYAVMILVLPFTFVFTALKNGGGPAGVGNTFMAVFLVMLLADWRNLVVMLVAGFGAAGALYAFTDPDPGLPLDYVMRLPVLVVGVVGGSLFKYAIEQTAAERVRHAYASLAGSIAHEMRNPMAQVRHSLENIRQALPLPLRHAPAQLVEGSTMELLYRHLAQGELAVTRGLQVIAMTLDEVHAKPLDAGKLSYLSAAEVCRKALQEYGYDNEQQRARVGLTLRQDFVFRGDESAFLFVLFNLIKNALYYLPAYPQARVELGVEEGMIRVRDTGPGIPPEVLSRLFQPFGTSGKAEGTGLGLAYCRRVLESFGGRISCTSEQGAFTEFALQLPVVSAQELASREAALLGQARLVLAGRRVLVVDDDPVIRHAARSRLAAAGCSVEECGDGVQALLRLQAQRFDAVVADLNMPCLDGYALATSLRSGAAPLNAELCILAHTSEPEHLARLKTTNAGMDGFVAKGTDGLALVDGLRHALEARSRREAGARVRLARRRILLADDNAYNRAAASAYLRDAGAAVTEVDSGTAVLQALQVDGRFDLVILDIHMPGLDGVQTARAVRQLHGSAAALPMLAITAYVSPARMQEAREAGIADFIAKPVDCEALYQQCAVLIGLAGASNAAAPKAAAVPAPADGLLEESRLQGYLRIGMLDELLGEYKAEADQLLARLEGSVRRAELHGALDALHSLVGMSGEAGAAALHKHVRQVYIPMLEKQAWPAGEGWVDQIRELVVQTSRALDQWVAERRGVQA